MSGDRAEIQVGNCLPCEPSRRATVHNVELTPSRGGQMGRSAGTAIQLMAKEGKHATLRLPSGEMRMVPVESRATIGAIGRRRAELVELGKAGRSRHPRQAAADPRRGHEPGRPPARRRRGSPHGRPSRTPWGVPTLGYRTRKKKKASSQLIVRGRRRGKKGKR